MLGPEDLSMNDMAAIVSDVLGRAVRYQQIRQFEAFKQQFLDRGLSEAFAQGYVDMYRAKDEGMDNCAKRDASSTTPTSFRQWCQEELKPLILPLRGDGAVQARRPILMGDARQTPRAQCDSAFIAASTPSGVSANMRSPNSPGEIICVDCE